MLLRQHLDPLILLIFDGLITDYHGNNLTRLIEYLAAACVFLSIWKRKTVIFIFLTVDEGPF